MATVQELYNQTNSAVKPGGSVSTPNIDPNALRGTGSFGTISASRGIMPISKPGDGATISAAASAGGGSGFNDAYNAYVNSERGQTVGGMYDKQTEAGLAGLKSAYEQNLSDAEAARGNIDTTYRGNANSMAAQYERQRRNNNVQAAANGLNTGTASQMQLAQNAAYQRDYGGLMGQYGKDVAESERAMANLKATYQNAIQQAQADGDYKRMAALLDDYNKQYDAQLQQAALLAQYGDFSGYGSIPGYSQTQIENMRNIWIAQNPLLAYNTGAIDANAYHKMTGKWPPGHRSNGSGGSGYNGRSNPHDLDFDPNSLENSTPSGSYNPGSGNAGYVGVRTGGRRVLPINIHRNERA